MRRFCKVFGAHEPVERLLQDATRAVLATGMEDVGAVLVAQHKLAACCSVEIRAVPHRLFLSLAAPQ